jgi:hypothetical protein
VEKRKGGRVTLALVGVTAKTAAAAKWKSNAVGSNACACEHDLQSYAHPNLHCPPTRKAETR